MARAEALSLTACENEPSGPHITMIAPRNWPLAHSCRNVDTTSARGGALPTLSLFLSLGGMQVTGGDDGNVILWSLLNHELVHRMGVCAGA